MIYIIPTTPLKLGDDVKLECEVYNTEDVVQYLWTFLSYLTNETMIVSESPTYFISGATESDSGEYTCKATTDFSEADDTVTLTIPEVNETTTFEKSTRIDDGVDHVLIFSLVGAALLIAMVLVALLLVRRAVILPRGRIRPEQGTSNIFLLLDKVFQR